MTINVVTEMSNGAGPNFDTSVPDGSVDPCSSRLTAWPHRNPSESAVVLWACHQSTAPQRSRPWKDETWRKRRGRRPHP